jgi:hypothetical protein
MALPGIDHRNMPEAQDVFANLGAFAQNFRNWAKDRGINLAPSILKALDKLDKLGSKATENDRKEVATVIEAWFTSATDDKNKMTSPEGRAQIKALEPDITRATSLLRGTWTKVLEQQYQQQKQKQKPQQPPQPPPYEQTEYLSRFLDIRGKGPVDPVASALFALDNAKTAAEAKPLAAAALKLLEREATEVAAEQKNIKDARKLQFSEYGTTLRSIVGKLKELSK